MTTRAAKILARLAAAPNGTLPIEDAVRDLGGYASVRNTITHMLEAGSLKRERILTITDAGRQELAEREKRAAGRKYTRRKKPAVSADPAESIDELKARIQRESLQALEAAWSQ